MSADDDESKRRIALKAIRRRLLEAEAELNTRRRVGRLYRSCVTALAAAAAALAVSLSLGRGSAIADRIEILCAALFVIFGGVLGGVRVWDGRSQLRPRVQIEITLEELRGQLRWNEASRPDASSLSQRLYKADIPSFIEQFQKDGERYRRRHNRLQSIVILGSLSTTTVASLGSAVPGGRWLTVGFSFVVGASAGFMGYFKFRERSFYLQQTADAIEAEDNAMTLRTGEYRDLEQETLALARLVERVEYLRNEQRRRQQQLDQPVEGHGPGSLTERGPGD